MYLIEFARFLKKRERFKLELKLKTAKLPSLKAIGYIVSIHRSLLRGLMYMRDLEPFFPRANTKKVTDSLLEAYTCSLVSRRDADYDPPVISRA